MHIAKSGLLALLLAASAALAPGGSAFAQSCACPGGAGIRAEDPPPPLPEYDQPPMPEPGVVWTPGYWAYNNSDYYWVPGAWVAPPHPGVLWTPGYWGYEGGLYVFFPGYWGPHVGFYGGVDYGFGYGGRGYGGGRWDGNVFYYNLSVTNVGPRGGPNVYKDPTAAIAVSRSRVSFNGGAGGAVARPTAEEEAAAKEPHEKPTAAQVQHVRTASMNQDSFASTNHGLPAAAATVRPGALNEAVRARPAGAAPAPFAAPAAAAPKPAAAPVAQPARVPEKATAPAAPSAAISPARPAEHARPRHAAPVHQPTSPSHPAAHAAPVHVPAKPLAAAPHAAPAAATSHPLAPVHAAPPVHAVGPAHVGPPLAKPPAARRPACGEHGEPPCR